MCARACVCSCPTSPPRCCAQLYSLSVLAPRGPSRAARTRARGLQLCCVGWEPPNARESRGWGDPAGPACYLKTHRRSRGRAGCNAMQCDAMRCAAMRCDATDGLPEASRGPSRPPYKAPPLTSAPLIHFRVRAFPPPPLRGFTRALLNVVRMRHCVPFPTRSGCPHFRFPVVGAASGVVLLKAGSVRRAPRLGAHFRRRSPTFRAAAA